MTHSGAEHATRGAMASQKRNIRSLPIAQYEVKHQRAKHPTQRPQEPTSRCKEYEGSGRSGSIQAAQG